jgi:hypothetical protein
MGLWNRLFGKKVEAAPEFYWKIVSIRGEITPGLLYIDLGQYETATDKPTPAAGRHESLEISQKIRPSVNRILAGQETPEDINVLELAIQKLL